MQFLQLLQIQHIKHSLNPLNFSYNNCENFAVIVAVTVAVTLILKHYIPVPTGIEYPGTRLLRSHGRGRARGSNRGHGCGRG